MKTDDLIDLLANGALPVQGAVSTRRFGTAIPVAYLGGALLMTAVYGVRPDLALAASTILFWSKLAFPLLVSIGALIAVARLARPAAKVGLGWWVMLIPLVLVWIAGAWIVTTALPVDREVLLLGESWRSCPFNITLLSLPGFAAVFWAVRGLAPTRPRHAGAAAGLLASSIGTVIYCFHCPEMSPAFWSIWYVLGMLIPATIGALLGPRLLRW